MTKVLSRKQIDARNKVYEEENKLQKSIGDVSVHSREMREAAYKLGLEESREALITKWLQGYAFENMVCVAEQSIVDGDVVADGCVFYGAIRHLIPLVLSIEANRDAYWKERIEKIGCHWCAWYDKRFKGCPKECDVLNMLLSGGETGPVADTVKANSDGKQSPQATGLPARQSRRGENVDTCPLGMETLLRNC